jgi:antitoxin VapB
MTTVTSRTFKSGNSVALRLPKELGYAPGVELTLVRSGDLLTAQPKRQSIAETIRRLGELPRPTEIEERDVEELPEPPGL